MVDDFALLGDSSILFQHPMPFSVVTDCYCQFLCIPASEFLSFLQQLPSSARSKLRQWSEQRILQLDDSHRRLIQHAKALGAVKKRGVSEEARKAMEARREMEEKRQLKPLNPVPSSTKIRSMHSKFLTFVRLEDSLLAREEGEEGEEEGEGKEEEGGEEERKKEPLSTSLSAPTLLPTSRQHPSEGRRKGRVPAILPTLDVAHQLRDLSRDYFQHQRYRMHPEDKRKVDSVLRKRVRQASQIQRETNGSLSFLPQKRQLQSLGRKDTAALFLQGSEATRGGEVCRLDLGKIC